MYIVYFLEDESGKKYTGYTSDINKRLWEHNNGITKTTRSGRNWRLIYSEEFALKSDAIKREKLLKTGKGREFLKTIISKL